MSRLFVTVGVIPAGTNKATYQSSTIMYTGLEVALTHFNGMLTSKLLGPFVPIPDVVVLDVVPGEEPVIL